MKVSLVTDAGDSLGPFEVDRIDTERDMTGQFWSKGFKNSEQIFGGHFKKIYEIKERASDAN